MTECVKARRARKGRKSGHQKWRGSSQSQCDRKVLKELKVSQSELLYMYVNFWPLAKGGTQNRGHGFWKYIGPRLVKNFFICFLNWMKYWLKILGMI